MSKDFGSPMSLPNGCISVKPTKNNSSPNLCCKTRLGSGDITSNPEITTGGSVLQQFLPSIPPSTLLPLTPPPFTLPSTPTSTPESISALAPSLTSQPTLSTLSTIPTPSNYPLARPGLGGGDVEFSEFAVVFSPQGQPFRDSPLSLLGERAHFQEINIIGSEIKENNRSMDRSVSKIDKIPPFKQANPSSALAPGCSLISCMLKRKDCAASVRILTVENIHFNVCRRELSCLKEHILWERQQNRKWNRDWREWRARKKFEVEVQDPVLIGWNRWPFTWDREHRRRLFNSMT